MALVLPFTSPSVTSYILLEKKSVGPVEVRKNYIVKSETRFTVHITTDVILVTFGLRSLQQSFFLQFTALSSFPLFSKKEIRVSNTLKDRYSTTSSI